MSVEAYEFAGFRLEPANCTLHRGSELVPLTPKAFDTLLLLVENRGRLLEKEVMMQRLWPDAVVEEANLANNISLLRKTLGDAGGQMIQTVPRRGYRFVAEVQEIGSEPEAAPEPAPEPAPAPEPVPERKLSRGLAIVAGVVVALVAGILVGRATKQQHPPQYTQLTFRRGVIWNARFAPDAKTVIYAGSYEGKPAELFMARVDESATRALGAGNVHLLAVSEKGELALMMKPLEMTFLSRGVLARMPIAGGGPREIADDVQEADWLPDGERLAVIRWSGTTARVEFPLNHPIYSAPPPVWVSNLRVSPDGTEIAFLLHESARFDDRGRAIVMDDAGKVVFRSREFTSANGLVWRGGSLVITASDGLDNTVYAIDRSGQERAIASTAGRLVLFDAARSGELLVAQEVVRTGVVVRAPGEEKERELSWLDGSWARDLSSDGQTLLFDEEGNGGGSTARVLIRRMDGSPAVDLGPGHAIALAPDGQWVLSRQRFTHPPRYVLIPTGAGESRPVNLGSVEPSELATWLPDGKRILFIGAEPKHKRRDYVLDVASGAVHPVTPEGIGGIVNDGHEVIARRMFYPIDGGGAPSPVPFLGPEDHPLRIEGRTLFVAGEDAVERLDLDSGKRGPAFTYGTARPQDALYKGTPIIAAGGRAYAYTYLSATADLYVLR